MNEIDRNGQCPHEVDGLESWDYGSDETLNVVITDRKVILTDEVDVDHIEIGMNGMLVFGEPTNGNIVNLRAKSVTVSDGGQFWIGSRSCRYQHQGYVTLYGNHTEMDDIPIIGQKFLWCSNGATCEFHGTERKTWTYLADHLFADNSAIREQTFNFNQDGLFAQRFSRYGAWKDAVTFNSGDDQAVVDWLDANIAYCDDAYNCVDDIYVIGSSGAWSYEPATMQHIMQLMDVTLDQSDVHFVATKQGEVSNTYSGATISEDITIQLGGQYTGHDMRILIDVSASKSNVQYTSTTALAQQAHRPIIQLADEVDWAVGDEIAVGSTDFNQDQTETFTIWTCDQCPANYVKLDRRATHLHWGRIDSRTGVDQRAPVMLMTRNVKIRGEVGTQCQYAKTRESQEETSANFGRNWCHHFDGSDGTDTRPNSGDMHGGHVIITGGFANVHISHVEVTKMGQPQLARYPLHWHFCDDVSNAVYEDPTSFESNSVHDAFNRFITIHGTEGALVHNNAAYKTRGHGYFIEDGWERYNNISHNLGMVTHQGIVLPTDQGGSLCKDANAGWNGQTDTSYCNAMSMFWISHIQNYVSDNVAIGARVGFWFINHNLQPNSRFWPSLAPFKNNRASSNMRGMQMESAVEEREPTEKRITARFGKVGSRQNAALTGLTPLEGCHEVVFDGWNIHHSTLLGVWIRQSSVKWVNGQFSDNQRGFTYPTSDCPGNIQTVESCVFQGMSENTGGPHVSWGTLKTVFNNRGELNEHSQLRPEGGHGGGVSWYKAPDGVYRSWAGQKEFPMRGYQLYDNYAATFVFDTHFYDWPNERGNEWYGGAMGVLLHNQFGMVAEPSKFWNLTYTNVARRVAFGSAPEEGTTVALALQGSTPWFAEFGSKDFGLRFLADGEKNFMLWDVDGTTTGTPETMVVAKENTPQIDDTCHFRDDFNAYQCPKTKKYLGGRSGLIAKKSDSAGSGSFNRTQHYLGEFQLNEREGEPGVFYEFSMGQAVTYSFIANTSYHYQLLESPPHELYQWSPEYMDKGDWVRLSFCLQGATPTIDEQEHYINSAGTKSYRTRPAERRSLRNVTSIDEMELENDVPSYWWDGQWLHVKVVGEFDRSEGGWLIDDQDRNITYAPNQYNHCHKKYGCFSIRFTLNNEHASGQACPPLPQPTGILLVINEND